MASSDHRVILELHGSKAKRGVELDGLESFIEAFRRAIREYVRAGTPAEEPGRGGHPGVQMREATNFRLVEFQTGSGIAALEPVEASGEDRLLEIEPSSVENLRGLMEAAVAGERDRLTPKVVEALESARKALGGNGRFGARFDSGEKGVLFVDSNVIKQLTSKDDTTDSPSELIVTGHLHLIEVEDPGRVEIRAANGVNWVCTYEEHLKEAVLSLVECLVRARGIGSKTGVNRGTLHLTEIEPIPEPEQTPLFTPKKIPTAELLREQGVSRPQGLAALQDPEWEDDEASENYLRLVSDDPA